MLQRLSLLLALLLAGPVQAQDLQLSGPVFSQIASIILPEGFKVDFQSNKDGFYILEMVPESETVDAWTQMVTLTANEGLVSRGGTVELYAQNMQEMYRGACPDTFAVQEFNMGSFLVPGSQATRAFLLGCGEIGASSPGGAGSEVVAMLIVAGGADMFTFQWAEHRGERATPEMFSFGYWKVRSNLLAKSARLCAIIPGEEAPYPSCSGT